MRLLLFWVNKSIIWIGFFAGFISTNINHFFYSTIPIVVFFFDLPINKKHSTIFYCHDYSQKKINIIEYFFVFI